MATIIGITGTLGAGKGTIVDYLVKTKGFRHYSVRAFLKRELAGRGNSAPSREDYLALGNELRSKYGGHYIVEQLLEWAESEDYNAIVESIRTTDEAMLLNVRGKYLWAVDADPRLRYGRVIERASETDNISFETFMAQEKKESESADGSAPNLVACRQLTEPRFRFINNESFDELHDQVEAALASIAAANK